LQGSIATAHPPTPGRAAWQQAENRVSSTRACQRSPLKGGLFFIRQQNQRWISVSEEKPGAAARKTAMLAKSQPAVP